MNHLGLAIRFVALLGLTLALSTFSSRGADTNPAAAPPAKTEETNTQETLRSYLQLQEQLHATSLAIERNRKEAEAAAARSTEALAQRLQAIEQSLASQRTKELEAMQNTNRIMVIVAGTFAAVGFMAMLLMAYFQWRTVNRLAEISLGMPAAHALGAGSALAALGPGSDMHLLAAGPAEQSNLRLLGAIEHLEKRIRELEHPGHALAGDGNSPGNGSTPVPGNGETATPELAVGPEAARIALLLGKGQSMLNLDDPEGALTCFDEILSLKADHTEALVKKGAALERLRKPDEAIECYDRAIAADDSMTIAWLYKGGLFNRMERFSEALECYEQALRTQEKQGA